MFRPDLPIVTIITAQAGSGCHHGFLDLTSIAAFGCCNTFADQRFFDPQGRPRGIAGVSVGNESCG